MGSFPLLCPQAIPDILTGSCLFCPVRSCFSPQDKHSNKMQGNAFMQEQGEQAQALGLLHDF